MEWARLVKDYLDVILWPFLGITFLAGTFLVMFRVQIASLIDRIRRIDLPGGGGISTPAPQPDKPVASPPEGDAPSPGEPPPAEPETDTLEKLATEANIQQLNESWSEVVRWYEYYYFYERTYRLLYGSQIALLEHLKTLDQKAPTKPHYASTTHTTFSRHARLTRHTIPHGSLLLAF